ncbi:MAG: hypothetical protein AB1400_05785 [Pseudomonadota bacterium]
MNGVTVTQMPTLCAPEKLDREALIQQLNYLQDYLMDQGMTMHEVCSKLAEMNRLANNLSSLLYSLIDAYDENDQAAIEVQLRKLSDQRKQFAAGKGKAH